MVADVLQAAAAPEKSPSASSRSSRLCRMFRIGLRRSCRMPAGELAAQGQPLDPDQLAPPVVQLDDRPLEASFPG
jgi:hypothetical protein